MPSRQIEAIREATKRLCKAESGVRVLRSLAWDPSIKERFFANGACALPQVEYPRFDPAPVQEMLGEARRFIGPDGAINAWLSRSADAIGSAADMLGAVGTADFLTHGTRLFGHPSEDDAGGATPLALAQMVDRACQELAGMDMGAPPPACHLAVGVAERLTAGCAERFGALAPKIVIVDHLSANALAGPRRIQIRRDACFTDLDIEQLLQHEAYIHVCTSLNGREQTDLPILAASHPGTTRTQEGLAVFSEFITGSLDLDRFRRLADRVLAIQMAIDGADFLEIYRYFLDRAVPERQAFEQARRVFRGGVLSGGAPFMKDGVYLSGFLRVTNFMRTIVSLGRVDCLQLLFCGKLDVEDIPALAQLAELGLCRPPRFLPPWASDRRYLITHLAYSNFLNGVRLDENRAHYKAMLADAPRIRSFEENALGSAA